MTNATHIVKTSSNAFFAVRDAGDPSFAHVWLGTPVTWRGNVFAPKGKSPREILVRRAGCRVVAQLS